MPKASTARERYGVHPGVEMIQKWVAELQGKTGRSLEEWIALVEKEGPKEESARREWLKTRHKFGTNSARWLAERTEGKGGDEDTPEAYLKAAVLYVQEQYAGPKEKLRAIYDQLLRLGRSLGADVKACPCKTIVPLYRRHVFAQIKPATNTRIDLGLALTHFKGKLPKRLVDTGGLAKKDRITHRIALASVDDIDADVEKWLRTAYKLDV
jgi:uncharacterized protein DUF5655/uncharacterized protein DUF4287